MSIIQQSLLLLLFFGLLSFSALAVRIGIIRAPWNFRIPQLLDLFQTWLTYVELAIFCEICSCFQKMCRIYNYCHTFW